MKNFRVGENRGITLVVLVITIVVMLIITTTVISLSTNNLKTKYLSNMYADIKSLDDKVAVFYNQYGTLPLKEKFTGSMQFQTAANPNDDVDGYYVIDVNKLNNLVLTKKLTWQNEDVYIINTKTHTIYYPHGVTLDGENYYRLPGEYSVIKEPENIEGEIAIAINPSTPTNKDVTATITWASGNYSATKEISTNGGTTYTEYKGDSTQISISENCVIKARIRKESEEIKTSSLEVSNIDKTNPTVTPKQSSATITEGDSNTLGNYFTIVANGKYGISSIVYTDTSKNNMTITNTNTLTEGSHIIKCTATKETGATASATMTIVVDAAIQYDFQTCTACNGTGTGSDAFSIIEGHCIYCAGTGKSWIQSAAASEEGGTITATIKIPKGIRKVRAYVGTYSTKTQVIAQLYCKTTGETWIYDKGQFDDPIWKSEDCTNVKDIEEDKEYVFDFTTFGKIWSNPAINQ